MRAIHRVAMALGFVLTVSGCSTIRLQTTLSQGRYCNTSWLDVANTNAAPTMNVLGLLKKDSNAESTLDESSPELGNLLGLLKGGSDGNSQLGAILGGRMNADSAKAGSSSQGIDLFNMLKSESEAVRILVSQHGVPDYILHEKPNSWVSFVFLKDNLFVELDCISGQRKDQRVDNVSESRLPPQYIAIKTIENIKVAGQAMKEGLVREENNAKKRADNIKAVEAAFEEQARKEKAQREKESTEAAKIFNFDMLKQRAGAQKQKTIVFKNFYLGMPIADCLQLANNIMGLRQTLPAPIEDTSSMPEAVEVGADPGWADAAATVKILAANLKGPTPDQLRAKGFNDEEIAAMGIADPTASYRVYSRQGKQVVAKNRVDEPFAVADASGSVISFQLSPKVLNVLFEASGMPTAEFLQSFINAYGLPKLEADRQKITATIMGTTKEIGVQNVYRHRNDKGYEVMYYADAVTFEDKRLADTPPEGTMTINKIETAKERESKFD